MSRQRSGRHTGLATASGVLFTGLVVVFLVVTLDTGAKVASIIGALAGVLGLILSWYAAIRVPREPDERFRRRAQFARHVVSELDALANLEDWEDERYAELEAEVEIEGRQRRRWFPTRSTRTLRRVRSLSVALERSAETLILLEGDPGSGKSIALRHLARRMASRAMDRHGAPGSVIPLYINLKGFRPDGQVDAAALRGYVIDAVNPRGSNPNVARFFREEYEQGIEDGVFLFLFDSFDEIPEILQSTEADEVVARYSAAIAAYLTPMSECRAVVASREFRGPRRLGWPRFRIVPMTRPRQRDLIHRWTLDAGVEKALLAGVATGDPAIRDLAGTPLFLGLLCGFMRSEKTFPENSHAVFERYVTSRLRRDEDRMVARFDVGVDLVRAVAEETAYIISTVPGMSLEVPRRELEQRLGAVADGRAGDALDALVNTKLARSVAGESAEPKLTFAHRRIQEYFATCVVLRHPERINEGQLLTEQNWRETAVTILQIQPPGPAMRLARAASTMVRDTPDAQVTPGGGFGWPAKSLHLLNLLNAGLGTRLRLPEPERIHIGQLLIRAWQGGRRHDHLWALEVAGLASEEQLVRLLQWGFASPSEMLRDEAYRQTGRLVDLPPSLLSHVCKGLTTLWAQGKLRAQLPAVRAQIQRLGRIRGLATSVRLLVVLGAVDLGLSALFGVALLLSTPAGRSATDTPAAIAFGYVLAMRVSLAAMGASPKVSWASSSLTARVLHWIRGVVARLARRRQWRGGLLVGLLLRVGTAVAAGSFAADHLGSDGPWPLLVGLLVLSVTWAPTALYLARSGRYLPVVVWPVLPAVPVWLAVCGLARAGARTAKAHRAAKARRATGPRGAAGASSMVWEDMKDIGGAALGCLAWTAACAALIGVCFGIVWLLRRFFPGVADTLMPTPVPEPSPTPTPPADSGDGFRFTRNWAIGLGGAAGVGLLWLFIRLVVRIVGDSRIERQAKRAVRDVTGRITVSQLTEILDRTRGDQTLLEILRTLRRKGALRSASDAVRFLSDLAACAEAKRRTAGGPSGPSYADDFRSWLRSDPTGRSRWVESLSDTTLDEIARLVAESG